MEEALLALPFGLLVGLLLGLVGGGGSILAVPVLVYALDQSPQAATSESLLIVGLTALIGAIDGGRAGRLRLQTGLVFATAGVLGSLPGTAVNRQIGSHALLLGFSAALLAAGVAMLRRRPAAEPRRDTRSAPAAAAGLGTGFLTGLFGVGGGFIIVPALVTLVGLPLQAAVGTSLLVIALTSAAALAAHLATGPIAWTLSLAFAAAAVAGVLAGRRLSHWLPARTPCTPPSRESQCTYLSVRVRAPTRIAIAGRQPRPSG
jgi:uncharacterized membrane protein YfcA